MTALRQGLPALPKLFEHLPIDPRGYPIPWFVAKVNGVHDFRVADASKRRRALEHRLCWLCGIGLGMGKAMRPTMHFVIGPMCAVNRNTSEPGCHLECALFAAQACPFMVRPAAQYRSANLPEDATFSSTGLEGNPGAVCIWSTKTCEPYTVPGTREWLIRLGEPEQVRWYAEGKEATRAQILASFERRLPVLRKMAEEEGAAALISYEEHVGRAMALLPAE